MSLYKSPRHAAKRFAKRYQTSLGGGWFRFNGKNMQNLDTYTKVLLKSGFILPWSDGRAEMNFEILDSCMRRRS